MNYNWPWHKIGQGQPQGHIYINFVVLQSIMLHTKFQGNWPNGSAEKLFKILSMAASLVLWLWPFDFHYFFPSHVGFISSVLSYCLVFFVCYFFFNMDLKNFPSQMTFGKVTKWPWPLKFICNEVNFFSDTLEYKSKKKKKKFFQTLS